MMWKDNEILMTELTAAAVEGAMMPQHQWYSRFIYTSKSATNLRLNSCPKLEETRGHRENTPLRGKIQLTQMITEMAKCIATLTTTVRISGYNQFSCRAPIVGTYASATYGHLKIPAHVCSENSWYFSQTLCQGCYLISWSMYVQQECQTVPSA